MVKGRRVSAAEYRTDSGAYVDGNLSGAEQKMALAQLDDVGRRMMRSIVFQTRAFTTASPFSTVID